MDGAMSQEEINALLNSPAATDSSENVSELDRKSVV